MPDDALVNLIRRPNQKFGCLMTVNELGVGMMAGEVLITETKRGMGLVHTLLLGNRLQVGHQLE